LDILSIVDTSGVHQVITTDPVTPPNTLDFFLGKSRGLKMIINGGRDINNLFRTHIEVGQSLLAGTLGNCQEQISIAQMLQSAHVPSPDVGVSEIGLLVKEGNQVIQGHHGKRRRVTTWLYGNTCIVGKALEETRDMNGIRLQSPDKMLSDRFGYPH